MNHDMEYTANLINAKNKELQDWQQRYMNFSRDI